jgi:hypothetical protein
MGGSLPCVGVQRKGVSLQELSGIFLALFREMHFSKKDRLALRILKVQQILKVLLGL